MIDAAPVGGDSVERPDEARAGRRGAGPGGRGAAPSRPRRRPRSAPTTPDEVSERGRARLAEVDRETEPPRQAARRRGSEGRRRGRGARAPAPPRPMPRSSSEQVQAEVDDEIEAAQGDAEAARERRRGARRGRDGEAGRGQAAGGRGRRRPRAPQRRRRSRQAQQLADEAEQQASDAEARVAGGRADSASSHEATAKHTARELKRGATNGDLESYNKPELVELAARHRDRGTDDHDQGRARRRDREGVPHHEVNGGKPDADSGTGRAGWSGFSRRSTTRSTMCRAGSSPDLPSVGAGRAVKAGLIAAGGLAGLTAGSAGISSLRRRIEGTTDES